VRRNHAFDRLQRATLTSHFDLDAVVYVALRRSSMQCQLIHIDKVLP
jgi:hypothetical protein